MNMEKIRIKHVGFDSCDREVFETKEGTLLVDVAMNYNFNRGMKICTKYKNEFDGEPDRPIYNKEFEVVKDYEKEGC